MTQFNEGDRVVYDGEIWTVNTVDTNDTMIPYLLERNGRSRWVGTQGVSSYPVVEMLTGNDATGLHSQILAQAKRDMETLTRVAQLHWENGSEDLAKVTAASAMRLALDAISKMSGQAGELARLALAVGNPHQTGARS